VTYFDWREEKNEIKKPNIHINLGFIWCWDEDEQIQDESEGESFGGWEFNPLWFWWVKVDFGEWWMRVWWVSDTERDERFFSFFLSSDVFFLWEWE
jgi:hypothetical protein